MKLMSERGEDYYVDAVVKELENHGFRAIQFTKSVNVQGDEFIEVIAEYGDMEFFERESLEDYNYDVVKVMRSLYKRLVQGKNYYIESGGKYE